MTFLAGDTDDTPMYTLSPYYQNGDGTTSSAVRHNGMYQFAFVDGHVKSVPMGAYSVAATGYTFQVMPKDPNSIAYYCRDVNATAASGYDSGMTCGAIAADLAAKRFALP
jgi:prepilin-type processing-associated H-X9-DG protein